MLSSVVMVIASVITRSLEALGVRGAPTLMRYLSRTPLSKGVATVRLPSGERITFPACDTYWCRPLYAGVPFEPDVEAIFRRFGPGRTLVDCGANIGYWSARAKGLGFKAAVAVEMNDDLIPFLRQNFDGPIHHAAVDSESGKTVRYVGGGAVGHVAKTGRPIQTIAIRDLGIEGPILAKLDVEGVEIPAIEGAAGMDAILVYEDWPRSGMEVTRYLLDHDYKIEGFDGSPIDTLEAAFEFNKRTSKRHLGASNLVAILR